MNKKFIIHAILWLALMFVILGHPWYMSLMPSSIANWYSKNPRQEGFVLQMVSVALTWSNMWLCIEGPKHGMYKGQQDWIFVWGVSVLFLLSFCLTYDWVCGPVKW